MSGMGSHQSHKMLNDEWLTPPELLKKLGHFDLDPCAPIKRPWDMADHHYTREDDGLIQKWFGRVWLNPPYGRETVKWMKLMCKHKNGLALIFARTETKLFFETVWDHADALLFIKGRIYFHHVDGTKANANAGAPSVLVAYGQENVEFLRTCGVPGAFFRLIRENREWIGEPQS